MDLEFCLNGNNNGRPTSSEKRAVTASSAPPLVPHGMA